MFWDGGFCSLCRRATAGKLRVADRFFFFPAQRWKCCLIQSWAAATYVFYIPRNILTLWLSLSSSSEEEELAELSQLSGIVWKWQHSSGMRSCSTTVLKPDATMSNPETQIQQPHPVRSEEIISGSRIFSRTTPEGPMESLLSTSLCANATFSRNNIKYYLHRQT